MSLSPITYHLSPLVVLVRHAAVEADPAAPAALWPLSDGGRQGARALARAPLWRAIDRIFTSPELKALETAQIIAGANGISVTAVEDLREVERPVGQWLDDYHAAVAAYFAAPVVGAHGWEPPATAQARIRACINELRTWEPARFAVIGHGLTLSLYVASLTGADPAAVWPSITLPDVTVVDPEKGTVSYPFGRWAAEDGKGLGVSALAPTAWSGDPRSGKPR